MKPVRNWLGAVVLAVALTACATFTEPYRIAETPEQQAAALQGDFEIYQHAALSIGRNEQFSAQKRLVVVQSARKAKPIMDDGDRILALYADAKAKLLAGEGTNEDMVTVTNNLATWYAEATRIFSDLKHDVEAVRR